MISAKNIQWIGISKILSMVISFVTTAVVARAFGPEKFGTLNYVLSFVGLFSLFATLGVSAAVYRDLVREKEKREEILGSAMLLTFITSVLTLGIIFVYLIISREQPELIALIMLAAVSFVLLPLNLLQSDFLKDSEAKYVTITQLITSLLANGAKIIVISLFGTIWHFIIILILENLIAGIIYIYQIIKIKKRTLNLYANISRVRMLIYSSLPYAISLSFMDIYAKIDQVMLKHYVDVTAVGFYAAATRVTELWYFIPNVIITGIYPLLAKSESYSANQKEKFALLSKFLFLFALAITLVVFLLRYPIINTIYGAEFVDAVPILAIYIFSLAGTFVSSLILQELFMEGKSLKMILLPGGNAVLNIILNLILIPLYGVYGAAIATVISYSFIPLIYYVIKRNVTIQK